MIEVSKNTANIVTFQIEHALPRLLFVATNRCNSSLIKYWIGEDDAIDCPFIISTYTDQPTEDPLAAEINLIQGTWSIEVYEQSSSINLDPSAASYLTQDYLKVL